MSKDRPSRLELITRIIRERRIRNQDELLKELGAHGVAITQATLSRDLKLLKVGKRSDESGGYAYVLPEGNGHDAPERYVQDIQRGFLSLAMSGNLMVMRTLSGHADSVALALDSLELEAILGTVAGDDTVIIVLDESMSRAQVLQSIDGRIPGLGVTAGSS